MRTQSFKGPFRYYHFSTIVRFLFGLLLQSFCDFPCLVLHLVVLFSFWDIPYAGVLQLGYSLLAGRWMVNGLRKLGGSCNVSSIASTDKRETSKQKPTHPRERKNMRKPRRRRRKAKKEEDKANFSGAFVIKRRGCNLGGLHWQCTIGRMIYHHEQEIASRGAQL